MMSCITPSIRSRTFTSLRWGSMWMSLAPARMALLRISLTARMIGASSTAVRRCSRLVSSCRGSSASGSARNISSISPPPP